ncbi:MAG TPA: hypothetical protein P5511_06790, partial [Candidatus Goldiibacteriota bacterium]|nr:hypothetical protein [Candidatus Goldiibacteriota bacterium]
MKKAVFTAVLPFFAVISAFGANYSTASWLLANSYPQFAARGSSAEAAYSGIEAASGNPAAIGSVENIEFAAMAGKWLMDTGMQKLSLAKSFEAGNFGFEIAYNNLGSAMRINADEFGNPVITGELLDMSAWGMSLIYAKKIKNFSLGAAVKGFFESLGAGPSFLWCADAGFMYSGLLNDSLNLGISILNISAGDGEFFTPINLKASASYVFSEKSSKIAGLTAGVNYLPREEYVSGQAGLDIYLFGLAALRAGASMSNSGSFGFSAGAGLKIDSMDLNYSYEPNPALGDCHKVSVSASFPKPDTRQGEQAGPGAEEKGTFESYLESGDYYYENKQYRQALKYYEYINLLYWKDLEDRNDKFKTSFYQKMGICYYNIKENKRAG